jgi:hypothetical protein
MLPNILIAVLYGFPQSLEDKFLNVTLKWTSTSCIIVFGSIRFTCHFETSHGLHYAVGPVCVLATTTWYSPFVIVFQIFRNYITPET